MEKRYKVLEIDLQNGGREPIVGVDTVYESAAALLASEKQTATVVFATARLCAADAAAIVGEIKQLRRSPLFCYAPVFFTCEAAGLESLCDGVLTSNPQCFDKGLAMLARGEEICGEHLDDSDRLRLLAYIFVRGEDFELKPYCVPGSKWIYGYPDASLIAGDESVITEGIGSTREMSAYASSLFDSDEIIRSTKLLELGTAMNYLVHTKVYNRIRLCPKCETGHLNYIDLCPKCGSLSIHKVSMLHCFTCGYVAPEDKFRQDTTLICPRCSTKLRHIGSDYDHPLESYICDDCGSAFVDPDVKASCLNCGAVSDTDSLIVKNYFGYRLAEKGVVALKTGLLQEDIMLFDGTNVVGTQTFCGLLKWLSMLKKRYADADFSLLGVKLYGLADAEQNIGSGRLRELIGELGKRIDELVRNTDITTKDKDGNFWLILPRTPLSGGSILAGRIENLTSLINGAQGGGLRVTVHCFPAPDVASAELQEELLHKLSAEF